MPQVHVGELCEGVWARLLCDVNDHDLAQSVEWYLKDLITPPDKAPRWPLPADILAYVAKYRAHKQSQAAREADCPDCGGSGLVFDDDDDVSCMRTCTCPLGQSKARWLASWSPSFPSEGAD